MTDQQRRDHERVRRELWAGAYLEAQKQAAVRVAPEFRFVEAADYALAAFDRRFGAKERTPDFSGLPGCPNSVPPTAAAAALPCLHDGEAERS